MTYRGSRRGFQSPRGSRGSFGKRGKFRGRSRGSSRGSSSIPRSSFRGGFSYRGRDDSFDARDIGSSNKYSGGRYSSMHSLRDEGSNHLREVIESASGSYGRDHSRREGEPENKRILPVIGSCFTEGISSRRSYDDLDHSNCSYTSAGSLSEEQDLDNLDAEETAVEEFDEAIARNKLWIKIEPPAKIKTEILSEDESSKKEERQPMSSYHKDPITWKCAACNTEFPTFKTYSSHRTSCRQKTVPIESLLEDFIKKYFTSDHHIAEEAAGEVLVQRIAKNESFLKIESDSCGDGKSETKWTPAKIKTERLSEEMENSSLSTMPFSGNVAITSGVSMLKKIDEFEQFGRNIAAQLKTLPAEAAGQLKKNIQNMVSRHVTVYRCTEDVYVTNERDKGHRSSEGSSHVRYKIEKCDPEYDSFLKTEHFDLPFTPENDRYESRDSGMPMPFLLPIKVENL